MSCLRQSKNTYVVSKKLQMQGAPDKQTHNALALMWSLMPERVRARRDDGPGWA
jgi:hypothetical protein